MEMTSQRLEDDQAIRAPKRRRLDEHHESEQGFSRATASTQFTHDDYTVGWICALPLEFAAAKVMLDQVHPSLANSVGDDNTYTLGQIGAHNIVIACMPLGVYGSTSAVKVATMMRSSFGSIRVGLMVGIGAGAPSRLADIRLGDVVVGTPSKNFGGVVQFDFGKDGMFKGIGALNQPPAVLLTAISQLRAVHMIRPSRIPEYLSEMVAKYQAMASKFTHPGQQQDHLFEAQYDHIMGVTCERCDPSCLVARPPRAGSDPEIHYGLIASGNRVMKHGRTRDALAREHDIFCFEMEAAGLMDHFPSLVIRGISDYADSHKNKRWQGYAAATAAAYAKEVLSVIPRIRNSQTPTAATTTSSQLPGAENLSPTGDLKLQAAIYRYNVDLLIRRLQAAHSELRFDNVGVPPEPTDDRSLSVYTKYNDAFLPTLFAQLAGSIYRPQGFSVPSIASHSQQISLSSLALEADPTRPRHRRDFRIALICALPFEADAVKAAFDKRWDDDGTIYGKAPRDQNAYSTGVIGRHNVVLAHMPGMGKETAASVAANFRSSFEGVQLALLVGVCGAVPMTEKGEEIFLGDVVISEGIIHYDFGKQYPDHFARKDTLLDSLGRPNAEIRATLAKLKSRWDHKNLEAKVLRHMPVLQQELGETSRYPGASQDKLFLSSYRHKHRGLSGCDLCEACSHKIDPVCDEALSFTCEQLNCGEKESVLRDRLDKAGADGAPNALTSYEPKVHFGLVASGNIVMKSGENRDQIAAKENVIAFEMEGAGVWDILPCLIIKGVCDYADSHKGKRWQDYAAVSAAACMKAFLENWTTGSTEF